MILQADADMDGQGKFDTKEQGERKAYSQQLLQPEWMVDIPADLYTEWLAFKTHHTMVAVLIYTQIQPVFDWKPRWNFVIPSGTQESMITLWQASCVTIVLSSSFSQS